MSSQITDPAQTSCTSSHISDPTQEASSFPTYSVTGTQGVYPPSGIINSSYGAYPGPTAGGQNNTYVINRKVLAARNGTLFDGAGKRLDRSGVLAIMMVMMAMMRVG